MLTLSFDIGIKNLAFCLVDPSCQILCWEIVDISSDQGGKGDMDAMASKLVQFLDELTVNQLQDTKQLEVLIENQPVMKAPTMKSIQMIIYSYFKISSVHGLMDVQTKFVSASKKNKYMIQQGYDVKPKCYKSNKENSILCVKKYLESRNDGEHVTLLEKHRKKDDLCDSLLQILSYKNIPIAL